MSQTIALTAAQIYSLDLSPAIALLQSAEASNTWLPLEQSFQFAIDFPRDPTDPRELSEIPEVRLWFIRLDGRYPWFPFLADWKAGELSRYAAMLIPHQFHPVEGIQYNPEALEIWVMGKIFSLHQWLKHQGIESPARLKAFAKMLGYEIDEDFFELLG
jgi:hypothetical protein